MSEIWREWDSMTENCLLFVSICNLSYLYTVAELVQSACPSNVYRLVYLSNLAITEV